MLYWTSEIKVPDTSVPKLDNANTSVKPNAFQAFLLSVSTGTYTRSYLTPEQQEHLVAWRPPREGDSNYSPPDGGRYMQDIILKESWVKAMMLRLVRDQLNACYKDNGVNHFENCAHLSELYLKWMREGYRVRGGRLRAKVDTRRMMRDPRIASIPSDAPLNRVWPGIDGKGPARKELGE